MIYIIKILEFSYQQMSPSLSKFKEFMFQQTTKTENKIKFQLNVLRILSKRIYAITSPFSLTQDEISFLFICSLLLLSSLFSYILNSINIRLMDEDSHFASFNSNFLYITRIKYQDISRK